MLAAVALVGMAGLQVLARAEQGYFSPLAGDLARRPPVGVRDALHRTTVSITCSPAGAPAVVVVGDTVSCAVSVNDLAMSAQTAPA
ncbi:MAG: hypothetical protein M3336_09965, partial [Chloroflexota bacterium]|nr:hypothetical protein [Chloroflexota bacterium]